MNPTEINNLLNNPFLINELQSLSLEKIVKEFPYFQSARALHLKSLYNQNSFKYNYELKITAAHTSDRSILFDYITSDDFVTITNQYSLEKEAEILEIAVENSIVVPPYKIEKSIIASINASNPDFIFEEKTEENPIPEMEIAIEKLEIGKPLAFSTSEKHSFQEWLQLSKSKLINRDISASEVEKTSKIDTEKQKKIEIIDKFIEANPKIPQIKHDTKTSSFIFEPSKSDNSYLMTETLAKVYLEQHKYQKAIQAYEILILKYPEKSSFFADRILDIKNLEHNNK
jgi:tetratricopeptide (TPR) repeat protein